VTDMAMSIRAAPGLKSENQGFTLIELMVGVVLVSILLSIGVPMFRDFILAQKLRATSSDLSRTVITARSEAVKRNRTVEVTPDGDGWGAGWTVNELDSASAIVEPPLFSHIQSGDVTITATTTPSGQKLRLSPSGRTSVRATFEIDVGPEGRGSLGCVELESSGRSDYCPGACPIERCTVAPMEDDCRCPIGRQADDGTCQPCPI
jgi:type IV fimbrial biogenesis protein FimT